MTLGVLYVFVCQVKKSPIWTPKYQKFFKNTPDFTVKQESTRRETSIAPCHVKMEGCAEISPGIPIVNAHRRLLDRFVVNPSRILV